MKLEEFPDLERVTEDEKLYIPPRSITESQATSDFAIAAAKVKGASIVPDADEEPVGDA